MYLKKYFSRIFSGETDPLIPRFRGIDESSPTESFQSHRASFRKRTQMYEEYYRKRINHIQNRSIVTDELYFFFVVLFGYCVFRLSMIKISMDVNIMYNVLKIIEYVDILCTMYVYRMRFIVWDVE